MSKSNDGSRSFDGDTKKSDHVKLLAEVLQKRNNPDIVESSESNSVCIITSAPQFLLQDKTTTQDSLRPVRTFHTDLQVPLVVWPSQSIKKLFMNVYRGSKKILLKMSNGYVMNGAGSNPDKWFNASSDLPRDVGPIHTTDGKRELNNIAFVAQRTTITHMVHFLHLVALRVLWAHTRGT